MHYVPITAPRQFTAPVSRRFKVTIDDVWAAIEATNKQLKETSRIVGIPAGHKPTETAVHFGNPEGPLYL
jgi:hypothetical protein